MSSRKLTEADRLMQRMKREAKRANKPSASANAQTTPTTPTTPEPPKQSAVQLLQQLRTTQDTTVCCNGVETMAQHYHDEEGPELQAYRLRSHPQPLRPHQQEAMPWMHERDGKGGGMLCDEMGLGKTRVMLTLMLEAQQRGPQRYNGATLIVASALQLQVWRDELAGFPPNTFQVVDATRGPPTERYYLEHGCDVVLATYASLAHAYKRLKGDLEPLTGMSRC